MATCNEGHEIIPGTSTCQHGHTVGAESINPQPLNLQSDNLMVQLMQQIVCPISHALPGNGGNSLFSTDFISLIVTRNGVTGRFLKFSPFWLILAIFCFRGSKMKKNEEN